MTREHIINKVSKYMKAITYTYTMDGLRLYTMSPFPSTSLPYFPFPFQFSQTCLSIFFDEQRSFLIFTTIANEINHIFIIIETEGGQRRM